MKLLEEYLIDIGNKLARLRLNGGFKSYESFAIENNLSRMQYWRIEKGRTNITMRSLVGLLQIHKVSIEDFFSTNFFLNFPLLNSPSVNYYGNFTVDREPTH